MFQGLGGKSPSEYALEGLESQERGIKLQDLYQKRQDDESLRRAIVTDPTSGKIDRQSTLRNLANKPHLQAQLGQEFARQDAEEQKAQSVIDLQQAQAQKAIQDIISKKGDDEREQMIAQAKDIAATSAWVRKQPNPAAAWDAAVESFGAPQEKGKYSPERLDMYEMTAKALMSSKPGANELSGWHVGEGQQVFMTDKAGRAVMVRDEQGNPVKAPPPSPGVQVNLAQKEAFKDETTLRKEYNDEIKSFRVVKDAYKRIALAKGNDSAASDISLIYGYMKLLDPGSVVREGEFATAQNAAGIPDRIRAAYNKAVSGERLSPTTKDDFLRQSDMIYEQALAQQQSTAERYRGIADRYGLKSENVVTNEGPLTLGKVRVSEETQKNQPKKGASTADELLKQLFGGK